MAGPGWQSLATCATLHCCRSEPTAANSSLSGPCGLTWSDVARQNHTQAHHRPRPQTHQRRDDVAQRRQAEVDLGGLLEAVAGGARLGLPLAARQVDQVELAHLCEQRSGGVMAKLGTYKQSYPCYCSFGPEGGDGCLVDRKPAKQGVGVKWGFKHRQQHLCCTLAAAMQRVLCMASRNNVPEQPTRMPLPPLPPLAPPAATAAASAASMVIVKTEWEREESWFMRVAPTLRLRLPACSSNRGGGMQGGGGRHTRTRLHGQPAGSVRRQAGLLWPQRQRPWQCAPSSPPALPEHPLLCRTRRVFFISASATGHRSLHPPPAPPRSPPRSSPQSC